MAPQNVGLEGIRTPLNYDFGHAPVGNLNGRRVELVAAQPARTNAWSAIVSGISRLGTRIFNALVPQSVRTEREFRQGLRESSQHVANMLAALSAGRNGPQSLALHDLLAEFPRVAAPVTRHGVDADTVLRERLNVHLAKMTPAQRSQLVKGLEIMQHGDPVVRNFAATVRQVMYQQLTQQAVARLEGPIQQAMTRAGQIFDAETAMNMELQRAVDSGDQAEAARLQSQITDQLAKKHDLLAAVKERTDNLLAEYGLGRSSFNADGRLAASLMKHALSVEAKRSDEFDFRANHLAVLIPAKDLVTVLHADPVQVLGTADESIELTAALMGAVPARAQRLENALRQHAEQLPALQAAPNQDAYLTRLGHLSGLLKELRVIDQHYAPDNDVRSLMDTVEQTITAQREQLTQSAAEAMAPAFQALLTADYTSALRVLGTAQERADTVLEQLKMTGVRMEGADTTMAEREKLIQINLNGLSNEQLTTLANALENPRVRSLADTLTNAGNTIIMSANEPHQATGRMLFNRGVDLQLLRETVKRAMTGRGLTPPAQTQAPPQPELETLAIIRHGTGVQLSVHNGDVRVDGLPMAPELQQQLYQKLTDMIASVRNDIAQGKEIRNATLQGPQGDVTVQVATPFERDLGRATFLLYSPAGDQVTALGENALQTIFSQAANYNPAMMPLLTHLAHQGTLAPMFNTLMENPELSPLRAPDGTPAMFMAGNASSTYHIMPDNQGGVLLHCEVDQSTNVMQTLGDAPRPYALDPQRSYQRFSYSIHIDSNLNAAPVGVATFDANYKIVPGPV